MSTPLSQEEITNLDTMFTGAENRNMNMLQDLVHLATRDVQAFAFVRTMPRAERYFQDGPNTSDIIAQRAFVETFLDQNFVDEDGTFSIEVLGAHGVVLIDSWTAKNISRTLDVELSPEKVKFLAENDPIRSTIFVAILCLRPRATMRDVLQSVLNDEHWLHKAFKARYFFGRILRMEKNYYREARKHLGDYYDEVAAQQQNHVQPMNNPGGNLTAARLASSSSSSPLPTSGVRSLVSVTSVSASPTPTVVSTAASSEADAQPAAAASQATSQFGAGR